MYPDQLTLPQMWLDDTCNVCDYKAINKNSINDNMKSVHDTKSSLIPYPNGIEEIHKLNECEKIVFLLLESLNSDVINLLMMIFL